MCLGNVEFKMNTLTVLIMNYNYGIYLEECIQSVLNQSVLPTDIHIVDDGSEDFSAEIITKYESKCKIFLNQNNLGIKDNFNTSITRVTTEYAMFLDSDNILLRNYVEEFHKISGGSSSSHIYYSDMFLFGKNAKDFALEVGAPPVLVDGYTKYPTYEWKFPEFTPEQQQKEIQRRNFIHGNSIFPIKWFHKINGIGESKPEDHDLWIRMISEGISAKKVPNTYLGYRKHSNTQAQDVLVLKNQIKYLYKEIERIQKTNQIIHLIAKYTKIFFQKILKIMKKS
jgi:GT2 family glycosyltransferase